MDIKKFYQDINGNYQAALSIMIKKFMENNAYHSIIEAYENKNIKEVFALCHSFKGVTGNLALTNLFNLASELIELTRDKETAEIDKEIEQLKVEYKVVEDAYNRAIQ